MNRIRFPIESLIAAILDRMSADGVGAPVFSSIPDQNQTFPYVVISDLAGSSDDTMTHRGWSVVVSIHCFSRSPDTVELTGILDGIGSALSRRSLDVFSDFRATDFFIENFSTAQIPDAEGVVQHGTLGCRWIVRDER